MLNYSLTNYQLPTKKKTSQRAEIIKELYQLYSDDKINRKKDNWKRYIIYLKRNNYHNSKHQQEVFRKSGLYINVVSINSFCYLLSHIKTVELPTLLSIAKDKKARKENVGAFIAGHFSKQVK